MRSRYLQLLSKFQSPKFKISSSGKQKVHIFEEMNQHFLKKTPTLIRPTFKVATDMVPDWKFFHPSFTFGVSETPEGKEG